MVLVCTQLEDIFVTERLLWHNICIQGDTTHKTMTSHCIWMTVQLPNMRVILSQAQLNKNVITKMDGEEREASIPQKCGIFLIHAPEEKL